MFNFFKKADSTIDDLRDSAKTIEETATIIKYAEYAKVGLGIIGVILLGVIAGNTSK